MKNIILISIFLSYSILMRSQTKEGMWLYSGSFEYGSIEKESSLRYSDANNISLEAELGKFLTRKQVVGGRLGFDYFKGGIYSKTNLDEIISENIFLKSSVFYRYYFINIRKLSLFAESSMKVSHLWRRVPAGNFTQGFPQFANYSGLGIALTFKNTAIEFNANIPFFRTSESIYSDKLYNFTLNRTIQSPDFQGLAKLEDTYLFVRNLYFGLTWSGAYTFSETDSTKPLINIGFFLANKWLLDLEFSGGKGEIFDSKAFQKVKFRAESAFFIRLNENGLYLRPAVAFEIFDGYLDIPTTFNLQIDAPNLIGSLELIRFYESHIMIGGGLSFRSIYDNIVSQSFSFSGTLRGAYFINENVAIEATVSIPAYNIDIIDEEMINRKEGVLAFTQLKIRTFIFQK